MSSWLQPNSLLIVLIVLISISIGLATAKDKHDHLSDERHYNELNEHNDAYDHEAFLGEDEARSFDNLSPEESRERLGKIGDKIDENKDGKVSFDELKNWIHKSQKSYILDDVERQWKGHKSSENELITWDEYKKATYGFMDDLDSGVNDDDIKTYKDMMRRDERRWSLADKNGDKSLSKDEFADFLHPEEAEHMKDVIVDETLEDVDKDKDGKISLDEYISDMYAPDATGSEIPDWVVREKEQFQNYRDRNKDGYMDREEVKEWIIPQDLDHSGTEAKHLISEADQDKDGYLTKDEILNSYDLFVGSQATDFGEALTRHDEL